MAVDNEQPADDLRSILAGAFDESSAAASAGSSDAAPAPKADETPTPEKVAEPKADGGDDRPRGEDGKFVKKEEADDKADPKATKAEPKEEPKADKDADKGKQPAGEKPDDKTASASTNEPPARWSASAKAMFKLQTPEAQAFLLDRAKELEADYTKKTQANADLKKEYEPVQQLFAPYIDVLKQKGLTPQTVIRRWAYVETALANGKGVDIIDGIVKSYGIDKGQLAQRLGFTSTPSGQASTDQPGTQPRQGEAPTDEQLLERLQAKIAESFAPKFAKIDQWETNQQTAARHAAQQRESAVETEISNFKSAVDDKGDLLHPYYDEVEPAMIALAQSHVAAKQPLPKINELYDMAVWANPSTRQALLATQKAAQEAKANEEARAKAASARRAASSVTGDPGPGTPSRPVRGELSLREQLEEAAADAG